MSAQDPAQQALTDQSLARRALALLDLTELGDTAGMPEMEALCAKALSPIGPPAAVCVWPRHVAVARQQLEGTGIRIATVVNFPHGTSSVDEVLEETRASLDEGADEIDLVLPYDCFLRGDDEFACRMAMCVHGLVGPARTFKVILETGAMPHLDAVMTVSRLAIDCSADFIKTSTGKSAVSATPEAARAMLDAIRASGRPVGLKVSGGIRTLADAKTYLDLADETMGPGWATPATFRFGASGLHAAIAATLSGIAPGTASEKY